MLAGVLLAAAPAAANPLGGQVVGGSATIATTAPGTLTIQQQSQRAAINWQSFNIAPSETTRFVQPSASSIALNRVKAGDPSVIAGQLTANGRLVLVNPSGVIFTRGAQVNAASLIATPTDISTADFMAGRMNFSIPSQDPHARIVNDGHITVADKGLAALVGPGVANNGVIAARLGTVVLGGAKTYTLDFYGDGLIKFDIGAAVDHVPLGGDGKPLASLVSNAGHIDAPGGTVLLTANAAAGILSQVVDAGGTINAPNYAQRSASVTIDAGAGNHARFGGTIDVSGLGAGEVGGKAVVTGGSVELTRTARIDARGASGGGRVSVGGGPHGADPLVRNALLTSISAGAQIDASATGNGTGGTVAVWSDGKTTFDGTILAKGGANGGDGGWVETSGRTLAIGADAIVNTLAAAGATGNWLLDPAGDVIIANANGNLTPAEIVFLLVFTNLSVTAGNDLLVDDPIDARTIIFASHNLDVAAGRSIAINAGITLNGGSFSATANDSDVFGSDSPLRAAGAGNITIASGAAIDTIVDNKGITLKIGTFADNDGFGGDFTPGSIILAGGLRTGSGTVTLNSAGGITGMGAIDAASLLIRSEGPVSLSGGNTVDTLAAEITGAGSSLTFNNTANALAVDTVGGVSGITTSDGDVTLSTTNSGDLTLNKGIAAGSATVTLNSAGGITGGIINADSLLIRSVGSSDFWSLSTVNKLAAEITGTGGIIFENRATTLTVDTVGGLKGITTANGIIELSTTSSGDIVLNQPLNAGTHVIELTSAGSITQKAGAIVTAGLATFEADGGSISLTEANKLSGAVQLLALDDASLANAAPLTLGYDTTRVGGNLTLTTTGAGSDLTIGKDVFAENGSATITSAGSISQTGLLETPSDITMTAAGSIELSGGFGAGLSAGSAFSPGNVTLIAKGSISQFGSGISSFKGGAIDFDAAGSIQIGAVSTAGLVTLTAGSTITQNAGTTIAAGTLTGSSVGGATLTGSNQIGTFGPFTDAGVGSVGISVSNDQALATAGTIASASGPIMLTTTAGGLTLVGDIVAGDNGVKLVSAGGITQTGGAIDPDSLLIVSVGSVSLTGANTVDRLAASITGAGSSLTFNNTAHDLAVDTVGGVSGITTNSGAVTLSTTTSGNLTLNRPIAAGTGKVTLNSAGTIAQMAGAIITADALTGSSAGGASLDASNMVKVFGPFASTTSGLLSFTDGRSFSTGGTLVSAGDLALTTTGAGSNMVLVNPLIAAFGNGIVTLTSAGTITQTGGSFVGADTLRGSSVGGADFASADITNFGPFSDTGGGNVTVDNDKALTVPGAVSTTGNITLFAVNVDATADLTISNSLTAGKSLTLFANGRIIETAGGKLTGANLVAVTGAGAGKGDISLDRAGANAVSGNVTLASLDLGDMPGTALSNGDIRFTDTAGFTIAAATAAVPGGAALALENGIGTKGTVKAGAAGDLTIAAGAAVTGSSVTLGAAGNFTNKAGAGAISAGDNWLVYSTNPNLDDADGLTPDFIQYAATFTVNTLTGTAPAAGGNGFLYSLAPVITLTGVTKVYDSTTALPGSPAAFATTGVNKGDTVTFDVSPVAGSYADPNAAGGIAVTLTALPTITATRGGIPVFGYTFGPVKDDPIGTITPASLAITAKDQSKTYGTTASLGTAAFTTSGLLGSDAVTGVTLTSDGAAATAGVGGYDIAASAAVGTGLGNYTIKYANGTLTVDPAALTVTATDQGKTYGTTPSLGTTAFTTAGLVNGDAVAGVTLTSTGAVATAGVGGYDIAASAAAGTGLGNYTIKYANGTLTVDPAALTVTAKDQGKTYGMTASLGTTAFTAAGLVNGDAVTGVTLTSTGAAATAGVGDYPLAASAAVGSGLANYRIAYVNGGLDVKPAVLTAGLIGTVGKDYDATTAANRLTPANYTLTGVVNGDAVTLNDPNSGIYATANVGTGIAVNVTGLALSGAGAANYVLASNSASGSIGTISPAELSVGLVGIVRKQFDGTTVATLMPSNYALSGLIGGDIVIVNSPALGSYASPSPGTGIPVTVSGLGLGGAAAGNYVLVSTGANGNIGEIFSLPPAENQVVEAINRTIEAISQPQPAAQSKPDKFFLPFAGNIACIASAGVQKGTHMPLLSGYGVTDTAGGGALLLDQPYAAAEVQNGLLLPITISACEALGSFQSVLGGLGR